VSKNNIEKGVVLIIDLAGNAVLKVEHCRSLDLTMDLVVNVGELADCLSKQPWGKYKMYI
jgi:hypothetical protein